MSNDIRVDLLKEAIARSSLNGPTKDMLADDLKYAQDINGDDDKALQGIKRLVISGVRRELMHQQRLNEAICTHQASCLGSDSIGTKGWRIGGKAALIVAVGIAAALVILAATGRLPL